MGRGLLFPKFIAKFNIRKYSDGGRTMNNVVKLVKDYTYNLRVESIHDEIEHCAEFFNLDSQAAHEYADKITIAAEQMYGMDGIFAIPSIPCMSSIPMGNVVALFDEYHLACINIKMILKKGQAIKDYTNTKNDEGRPRVWRLQSEALRARWRVDDKQKGDIILIAAQLGREYIDTSLSEASLKMFRNERGEFHLDFVHFGAIILLHPERMERVGGLGADIFGTKISTKNKIGRKEDRVPTIRRTREGVLEVSTYYTDNKSYLYGIPSGIIL